MSPATTSQLGRTPLLAEKLADRLRREINTGHYKAGQRLPTERVLAEVHGVSRPIVREALGRLKQDNLVHSRQGSGVFVAEGSANVFRLDQFDMLNPVELKNIVELLTAVESAASAHAAARRTKGQLAAIRARFAEIEAAMASGQSGIEEDVAFHRAIIEATGNPIFRDMLDFLDGRVRSFIRTARTNSSRFVELRRQAQQEHAVIVEAIADQDEEGARRAAAGHLTNALGRLAQSRQGFNGV